MSFDVEAATQAYLVDQATGCERPGCEPEHSPWLGYLLPVVTLAALALFILTPLSRKWADLTGRVTRKRAIHWALYGMGLALFVIIARAPFVYCLERVLKKGAGPIFQVKDKDGNSILPGNGRNDWDWLVDYGWENTQYVILAAIAAIVAMVFLRKFPRAYWIVVASVAAAYFTHLAWFDSPYRSYYPLPEVAASDAARAVAHKAGFPEDRIVLGRSDFFNFHNRANAVWINGRQFIVLSDKLFNILPVPPENISPKWKKIQGSSVEAITGHEIGHIQKGHLWKGPLGMIVLIFVLCFVAARAGREFTMRRYGEQPGVSMSSKSLPAYLCAFLLAYLLFNPLYLPINQMFEREADRAGLELARNPHGIARFHAIDARDFRASKPLLQRTFLYTHPQPEERIRRAMQWLADHPGEPVKNEIETLDPTQDHKYFSGDNSPQKLDLE